MKQCIHCQAELPDGARICRRCGASQRPSPDSPQQVDLVGSGAIAIGEGAVAAGAGGVAIGGDFTGTLIVDHPQPVWFDYAGRIQNFVAEYTGTPENPVPFAGRRAEMAALDRWLTDAGAPPYALIAAEAGRGKSALLVRWTRSVIARGLAHVVFIPISARFNTHRAGVALAALAVRLGELYEEPVSSADLSVDQWRETCLSYLCRTPPTPKPVLVVLDGLDEAADWRAGPDLFPLPPTDGVRAVVSARYLVNDVDGRGWLRRLGWAQAGLARAMSLPPLTRADVREMLRGLDVPLLTRPEVVEELFRLSRGDPLVMRLYLDALRPYGQRAASLRPRDLPEIEDGLSGYFARWWADQRKLWGQAAPLREGDVQLVLNLLACALGPVSRDDLLHLAPADAHLSTWGLERAQDALARFVTGDGDERGYVFSHPRLGHYFRQRLTEGERRVWERRFLDYGRDTLDRLNAGTLAGDAAPSYVLDHYRSHLRRARAPLEEARALISEGWLGARRASRSTRTAFLDDVAYVWRRAEAEDHLPVQVQCALCHASLAVMSAHSSPTLLALALAHGLVTPLQALRIVQAMRIDRERHETLSAIMDHVPPSLLTEEFGDDELARSRRRGSTYAEVFGEPAFAWERDTRIPLSDVFGLSGISALARAGIDNPITLDSLPRVLDVILAIEDRFDFLLNLSSLSRFLTPPALASRAFLAAGSTSLRSSIPHRTKSLRGHRELVLARLAGYIPPQSLPDLLRRVISRSTAIGDEWQRAVLLTHLTRYLSDEAHERASSEALATLTRMRDLQDDPTSRAIAFARLVPHLVPRLQGDAFARALHALGRMPPQNEDEYHRLSISLVSHLRPRFLSKAAATAAQGARPLSIFLRLCWLFVRRRLVRAKLIQDPPWRAYVWGRIGHAYPGQDPTSMSDRQLLAAALATADTGYAWDPVERATILDDLALDMPDDLLPQALAMAVELCGHGERLPIEGARIWALTTLGARLTEAARSRPDLVHAQGQGMLRFLATLHRPELLRVLDTLVDFYLAAVEEGERGAVAGEISHAVREVCRWWP